METLKAWSEALFRTLSEKALVGVYVIQDNTFRYVNPALAEAFGYEVEEIVDRLSPTDLVAPEDRAVVAERIQRRLDDELEVENYFFTGLRKDGRQIECEVLGRRADYHGRPAIVGTMIDVTERRRAQESLRQSEERLRTYFEEASDWIFTLDAAGRINSVNRRMCESSGYTPEELIGSTPTTFLRDEDAERVSRLLDNILEGDEVEQVELPVMAKDGQRIWLEIRGRTLVENGEIVGAFHIGRDVTERKRAEEAQREQRALAEALGDTATVLNSTLNLDQVLERILNNVGRVVPHDGANIMLFEDDVAHVVRCQGHYRARGVYDAVMALKFSVSQTHNFKVMAETGQPYVISDTRDDPAWAELPETDWVRSYVGAPISRGDTVIGFLNLDSEEPGFFRPSHAERLQAFADQVAIAIQNARLYQELETYSETLEEAVSARTVELRRTTEQVEVILNNSPDAILLLNMDGTVKRANPAFYEMFGFAQDEVLHKPLPRLVSPKPTAPIMEALHAVIERGKKLRLELVAQRQDGSTFDADVAMAPVKEDGVVRGGVCSLRDISRFKEVDRMKDAFVSNVSHELRTPITSLRLYHDLLVRNPQKASVYLERLEREINRLNTIIEDLLRLSRLDRGRIEMTPEEIDLNQTVEQYVQDRLPLARQRGLHLSWSPAPDLPPVQADQSMLEQVLGILLTNALNYTPTGGQVTVSVSTARRQNQQWVICCVSDTGPGISREEQSQLFDRFFRGDAAKDLNSPGTGLGLAIAREIVERHQGFIEVESEGEVGKGASFSIWLPADSR